MARREKEEKEKKNPPDAVKTQNDKPEKILATHPTKNYSSCKKSSQRQIRKMDKGCKQFIEREFEWLLNIWKAVQPVSF